MTRVPVADLGQLVRLLDALGAAVTITPILEKRIIIGGVTTESTYGNGVAAWEISFTTAEGSFTFKGETVAEAVETAFADGTRWGY